MEKQTDEKAENKPNVVDWLTVIFAGVAVIVSAVGLWLTYFNVTSRLKEIEVTSKTAEQVARNGEQRQLCFEAGDLAGRLAFRVDVQANEGINHADLNNFKIFLSGKKDFIENEEIKKKLQDYDEKLWHEQNPQNQKSNWYKCEPYNNDRQRKQYEDCEAPLYDILKKELTSLSTDIQAICRKSSGAIAGK
jgi:flagellar biosynthesis/type III secretory pathway M-ring protein FliF/YscJ